MGGVEDTEPPHKRAKVPFIDLDKKPFDNSTTKELFLSLSLGDSMAWPLSSKGDGETLGPKGVIKKHEFVKVITNALYSPGYDKTGALLQEESGMQPPAVSLFMQQVQEGEGMEREFVHIADYRSTGFIRYEISIFLDI